MKSASSEWFGFKSVVPKNGPLTAPARVSQTLSRAPCQTGELTSPLMIISLNDCIMSLENMQRSGRKAAIRSVIKPQGSKFIMMRAGECSKGPVRGSGRSAVTVRSMEPTVNPTTGRVRVSEIRWWCYEYRSLCRELFTVRNVAKQLNKNTIAQKLKTKITNQ